LFISFILIIIYVEIGQSFSMRKRSFDNRLDDMIHILMDYIVQCGLSRPVESLDSTGSLDAVFFSSSLDALAPGAQ
jgi:hypothetical protein